MQARIQLVTIIGAATLLLHFSSIVSRLSDQSETLAQRQAPLDERLQRPGQLAAERENANRLLLRGMPQERLQSQLGAGGQRPPAPSGRAGAQRP